MMGPEHLHFHSIVLKCTLSCTLLPCLDADEHRSVSGMWSLTTKMLSCAPVCRTGLGLTSFQCSFCQVGVAERGQVMLVPEGQESELEGCRLWYGSTQW